MDRSQCGARYHGTWRAYCNARCRCADAREDWRLYNKRRREERAPARLVPALGYLRMVRALQAIGWPVHLLARNLDVLHYKLHALPRRQQISTRTARQIQDLYDRLGGHRGGDGRWTPPVDGPSRISEARAWAAGWAPPGAWAGRDIHDPAAQPDWIRADDPDEVAAEQVARGEMRFADLRSEDERLAAYQLAARAGISQRFMQAGWKVSSRVITRLKENTP